MIRPIAILFIAGCGLLGTKRCLGPKYRRVSARNSARQYAGDRVV